MLKMSMETQNESSTNLDLEDEIKEPPMCKVILLNDDFTTKEFVVEILITLFNKSSSVANELMETIHKTGSAIVGIYSYDIAKSLAQLTIKTARENGFPLRCEVEEE
jgi:ATP-dependent Clp protease adaptor protein ClpS